MEDFNVKLYLIRDADIEKAIDIFSKNNVLASPKCYFCKEDFTLEKFAGFVPLKGKIAIFCTTPTCTFHAIFARRVFNGNGEI